MKSFIIITLAFLSTASARIYSGPCRLDEMSARVKTNFQVSPFMGVWYQIGRYDTQTNYVCVTSRYSLNNDGSIHMSSTGFTSGGTFRQSTGQAQLTNPNENPLTGKLDVTGFGSGTTSAIFWVMDTDYSDYAVVWSCRNISRGRSEELAWVLARTPQTSEAVRQRYENAVHSSGLVLDAIRLTNQDATFCTTSAIFWVMDTDYSDYAVVWSCRNISRGRSEELAWVLARTPQTSEAVRQRYENAVHASGLVLDAIRLTNQNTAFCNSL
ncbi:CLUMA_CG009945, isoform A [Clunio marinus]|uniref:CLUMA_CG009945, isoform A n=1 Tax=Clunio marinus TaxID=568069 RepID=A0A1J1I8U6_9DIPT|nr:CLUMA_CG009945, isoform A [Clunio marinus]